MDTGLWGPWVLALSPCPQVPLGSPVTVQVEGHGEGTLTVGGCMDTGVISKTDVPSQPPLVVSRHAATVSPAVPSWCHAVPRCSASSACCHLRTPRARRCTWRWPSPAPSCTMVRPHPKAPPPFLAGGVPSTLFCISQPPADEDYEDYEDYEEAEPKEGEEPTEGAVPVEGAGPADDPAPLSPVSLWDARKRQRRSTHNPAHEVAFLVCFR